ncbi:ribonuclease H-like domain-containing protein [Tanacetum coccineum]
MKKFYKKTGRRVRIDGNKPVGFDKKKLECFKCHNTGHFARECPSKGTNDGKKRDSFYQDQGAGRKEQNQNCLLTMDDGEQEAKILAYTLDVKKLEAQVVTFQKKQLSLNEQLTFQANEIYAKDEKFKKYRRIGMKAVKEKEQLHKIVDSWKNSSKNLWKLVDSDFSKMLVFKGVPHPLTGDYTPKPQEEIDDSLYVYGKKGPQKPEISDSDDSSNEHSSCQSNDSEGSFGNPSEHSSESESESLSVPKEMSTSNLSHLIKDCDFYEKKMAREAELKKQRVFNTGNGVAKPVWNNANRVNHANHFVPRPVQLIAVRQNVNSVRPNVNTGRANVNSVRQNVNSVRSNVNTGRSKQPVPTSNSNSFSPVRPQGTAVKTSAGYNWRGTRPNSNYNSGSNFVRTDHPLKNMEDKGGSVTFRGSKGYITGKGRIRVGNLDFDSVSFVKELGHFNLFSISQICDKHHKVLFTETECLVVSPDFKMPDENQILLLIMALNLRKGICLNYVGIKGNKTRSYSNAIELHSRIELFERMYKTNEAARTMLADSLLPTTFWTEVVSTACYIFNRVRVTKPQNKTPYELLFGHKPIISYIRPFGYHVTILDTLSVLGEFDGKCDEGFLVGYSLNSKAFRVYNLVTKKVEVNLHVKFLEEKPNVKGVGYRWMFDIDYLTDSMNYIPVALDNQTYPHAGTSEVTNSAGTLQTPNANAFEEEDKDEELIVVPTAVKHTATKVGPRKSSTNSEVEEFLIELQNLKTQENKAYSIGISEDTPETLAVRRELDELAQKHLREITTDKATSTNSVNSGSEPTNTQPADQDNSDMAELTIFNKPQKGIFDEASYDEEGMVHDFNNLPTEVAEEPKKISEALKDDSWVEAMQEELLQFRLQQVWILVDLPHGAKVYVSQPPGFVDPDHPKKVYKVVKALYGLHQAPRALDKKSITGGCQFLGSRLISWQCKKQTIVATSTIEAEYVAAASCCGQVLWIQNQMLDYGFNFMNTKIHIDNESTICIVKNLVYHSKTKHIEIRHHFIQDL